MGNILKNSILGSLGHISAPWPTEIGADGTIGAIPDHWNHCSPQFAYGFMAIGVAGQKPFKEFGSEFGTLQLDVRLIFLKPFFVDL